jgi:hypothetical protein
VWPQLVVAAMLALAYGFVPTESVGVAHSVDLVMSLADCVALSVVGAYVLDRQRRQAFREREEAPAHDGAARESCSMRAAS